MAQLGRYAKITRTALDAYRLVQDTHLPVAPRPGAPVCPVPADPIESHLYLDTPTARRSPAGNST